MNGATNHAPETKMNFVHVAGDLQMGLKFKGLGFFFVRYVMQKKMKHMIHTKEKNHVHVLTGLSIRVAGGVSVE